MEQLKAHECMPSTRRAIRCTPMCGPARLSSRPRSCR
jgi:hypothetical protein